MDWNKRVVCIIALLAALAPLTAFADPAFVSQKRLVVPRVEVPDMGPLALEFAIDTRGGVNLFLESFSEADPGTADSAWLDPDTGALEIFEVRLGPGESYYAVLERVSEADLEHFRLQHAVPITPTDDDPDRVSGPVVNPEHEAFAGAFEAQCATCHGDNGLGTPIAPALVSCATCTGFDALVGYIRDTMPLGNAGACDADCAADMANYILSVINRPVDMPRSVEGLRLAGDRGLLRKASMLLVGRLPTEAEIAMTGSDPAGGFATAVSLMLEEEAFLDRVADIFNLYLLTDKYRSRNASEGAVRLLNRDDYPEARWFDPEDKDQREDESYELNRYLTNEAIAREPLELIKHVVRENRPMSEILTADYLMLNPWSARSYGVNRLSFRDAEDPAEFVEAKIPGIPHAGILTSTMFLNRYPTSYTNRNRGRARVVFDYFLDTDILAIEGTRPGNAVDITSAIPTIDNPECSKCHSVLDPVASLYQNWDDRGAYRPSRLHKGWFTDMEVRGFAGKAMPLAGNADNSVQWLAAEIAKDPRFARAMVRILFRGLVGREPLDAPGEDSSAFAQAAYRTESATLSAIQQIFEANDLNLKTLVREILLSPTWQAAGLDGDADPRIHQDTGAITLLGPDRLNDKLGTLTGIQWRGPLDDYHRNIQRDWEARLLNREQYFHQIYGGIDSDNVVKPLTEPNGLMGAVQIRMANEMACYLVPNEFLNQKLGREDENRLFPHVDLSQNPYHEDWKIDEEDLAAARKNIQHLHALLLGEYLPLDSGELDFTVDLFMAVLAEGRRTIEAEDNEWYAVHLPGPCKRHRDLYTGEDLRDEGEDRDNRLTVDEDYLIRSWMAVVAYLLADYRFVYE